VNFHRKLAYLRDFLKLAELSPEQRRAASFLMDPPHSGVAVGPRVPEPTGPSSPVGIKHTMLGDMFKSRDLALAEGKPLGSFERAADKMLARANNRNSTVVQPSAARPSFTVSGPKLLEAPKMPSVSKPSTTAAATPQRQSSVGMLKRIGSAAKSVIGSGGGGGGASPISPNIENAASIPGIRMQKLDL